MAEALEQIAAQTDSLYQAKQPATIDIYTGGFLEMYDMGGMNDHGSGCPCPMCCISNKMAFDHMPEGPG